MKRSIVFSIIFVSLLLMPYQQCSISSEEGLANLGSNTPTPPNNPGSLPSVQVNPSTITVPSNASIFPLTGTCSVGSYQHEFELKFTETSTGTQTVRRFGSNACSSGNFNLSVTVANMNMRTGFPGTLGVRIVKRTTPEVFGPEVFANILWGTVCTPTCSPTRACGSTQDSCGGNTCSPQTAVPPCSPSCTCSPSRACGSTQDSCGGNTCAPQTAVPPCSPPCVPTCSASRACGSTTDSCGGNTCAAQTAIPPCTAQCTECCAGSWLTWDAGGGWPSASVCSAKVAEAVNAGASGWENRSCVQNGNCWWAPPCSPDCSASKLSNYDYCNNSVPNGCTGTCSHPGTRPSNCPPADTICSNEEVRDQCNNICEATLCCPRSSDPCDYVGPGEYATDECGNDLGCCNCI